MSTPSSNPPQLGWLPYVARHNPSPPGGVHAFRAEQLCVAYPRQPSRALHEVTLAFDQGGCIALVGPNGAGKSTLLKALAGVLPIGSGKLEVFGQPPGTRPLWTAYLAQRSEIDWRFPINVERLVLSGAYGRHGWLHRPGAEDRARTHEALNQLGLFALRHRQVGELSGGQQQRVLLARTLVQNAALLLLDEPLNAVDVQTRRMVDQCLERLRQEGRTVVIATHDLGRAEADFDHAVYLAEGRLVQTPPGAPDPCHGHHHVNNPASVQQIR